MTIEILGRSFNSMKGFNDFYRQMANDFNSNLLDLGDDLALSSYYAQHMAPSLAKASWTKSYKNMPYREQSNDPADKVWLAKINPKSMSLEEKKEAIKQMAIYNTTFIEGNIMSKSRILEKADAHMKFLGITDKAIYTRVNRIVRNTDLAAYIIYEIDPTANQTVISNAGKILEKGFSEQDVEQMINNMFQPDKNVQGPQTLQQIINKTSEAALMDKKEVEMKWLT